MSFKILNIALINFILVFNFSAEAQPKFRKIFQTDYKSAFIKLRIENSGIYGLKSFEITYDKIAFLKENNEVVEVFPINKKVGLTKKAFRIRKISGAGVFKSSEFAKDYYQTSSAFKYGGGVYYNNQARIVITRVNLSTLNISGNLGNKKLQFELKFPNDLAYASLIGIDSKSRYFIEVQRYASQIPLKIKREIIVVDSSYQILNKIEAPIIKYATVEREFDIDAQGNLFQLLTYPDKLEIVEWEGLGVRSAKELQYPEEYRISLHYNDYVKKKEIETQTPQLGKSVSTTRAEILKRAEKYVEHKYYCTSKNLAPNGAMARDGDVVKTPAWLKIGWNARIPYKWGGFNTVHGFDIDLYQGEFAGDIDTRGVSGYAVGVDCSGFVSRCWGLTYHAATIYMPNITTAYHSWEDLKPGDAIHKVGHVRLFVRRNRDGSFKIVEASARNWDVSYWSYAPADLQNYKPRYLNTLTKSYFEKSVKLVSVVKANNDSVKIKWQCDTTGVASFRLYYSYNGEVWYRAFDEIKSDSLTAPAPDSTIFFRVSAIGLAGADTAESLWSNPMAINPALPIKALIVNGFNRDYGSGSWQGEGNPFTISYGKALAKAGVGFESVKNSQVEKGEIDLNNYEAVFWYLGDESTQDETFSSIEQAKVKRYLENGGKLFVSGSEVGWDLGRNTKSSASDVSFYNNYLKAKYLADDAQSTVAKGVIGGPFENFQFNFGQTFTEDYPDVIQNYQGSSLILKYGNGKGAAVFYNGEFGSSAKTGAVAYFGFTLESVADDSVFNAVVAKITELFGLSTSDASLALNPQGFMVFAPFPNPFNPSTNLSFYLPRQTKVKLEIFNLLGQKVKQIFNGTLRAGLHKFQFNGSALASGVYFSVLSTPENKFIKKLMLIK